MTTSRSVVVGVTPHSATAVATWAVRAAGWWGADLVFVSVNAHRQAVRTNPDGTVVSTSSYADCVDETTEVFSQTLHDLISGALSGSDISWSVRARAGMPAQELAAVADELDAAMIVVGARRSGLAGFAHKVMDGDVVAQLGHGLRTPVLVVPRDSLDAGLQPGAAPNQPSP